MSADVGTFVLTSSTSVFGDALTPPPGAPAIWITEDAVDAHLLAMERAAQIGFGTYIISATTPFTDDDRAELRTNAPLVVRRHFPAYEEEYARREWSMFPTIERVYANARARAELGWEPRYDYGYVLEQLRVNAPFQSPLARSVGVKGYHGGRFGGGRYPTE